MRPFDPTAPLEPGITLIEASAGTGKTFSITSLVLQLIGLHDVPLREILLVTFTRNATAELRERLRMRLVAAVTALSGTEPSTDPVLATLQAHQDPAIVMRLRRALERYDECVIRTIHGFCQRMLQQFAAVAGADVDLELDPDALSLVDDLVDDWLSSELYPDDAERYTFLVRYAGFEREGLLKLAQTVVNAPELVIEPPAPAVAPDLSTLRTARQDLADAWLGGWDAEVEEVICQAHAAKQFAPRQRTYTAKTAPKLVAAVTAWLTAEDRLAPPPADAVKLFPDPLADKTVGEPVEHPAFQRLADLAALPDSLAALQRSRFVAWVRDRFQQACAIRRVQPYADLVRSLADRVAPDAEPTTRAALIDAIGGSFQAALIDEFQDTDEAQWTLFRELFGQGRHHLYLIGDPKQAIYGFRGANVQVYLNARQAAGEQVFTMTRNYRSDGPLLRAMNHLMREPGVFGGGGIEYVEVDAPERIPERRLAWPDGSGPVGEEPLQVRWFDEESVPGGVDTNGKGLTKGIARPLVAEHVASDIVALLASGATIRNAHGGSRPLVASDIAVLVRSGFDGDQIQAALRQCNVPAVQTGRRSVLASEAARELQLWLAALVHSGRDGAARAAGTTHLFGHTADVLIGIQAGDAEALRTWDGWLDSLARWRDLLERSSFLRALRAAMAEYDVRQRVLAHHGGERYLTDLLHTAELVHAAQVSEDLHGAGLLAWLGRERHDASTNDEDAEVRLERDDDAVTIMTIHKSKGLQFPVVFAPFLWSERKRSSADLVIAPHPDDPAERVLHLDADPIAAARAARADFEEAMRLLYVAFTRAALRLVVYTGWVKDIADSAIAPLFYGDAPDRIASASEHLAGDPGGFEPVRARCDTPDIALTRCEPLVTVPQYRPEFAQPTLLSTRRFARPGLDRLWKRYSYTALTRGKAVTYAVPEEREGFDPDRGDVLATPPTVAVPATSEEPDVPLATFPAGARAGIFLHEVFENIDFTEAHEPDRLRDTIERLLQRHGYTSDEWLQPLTEGLASVLRTPLGGPLDRTSLSDIPRSQRFDELRFDYPLAGGDQWGRGGRRHAVQSSDLIEAIQLHPANDAMGAPYIQGLSSLDLGTIAGFMTGSIDLVFRHDERWYVADYKSNRIDPDGTRRYPVSHFTLAPMRQEMEHHHYYLQYHLYTLALHRYLSWRVPDYDYDTHMGGVYYLFFRGMVGPQTPRSGDTVAGCFFDRPPAAVIHALDAAFRAEETP